MIAQLSGRLIEKTPTSIIIDCNGVGYELKISLYSYSLIGSNENLRIYTKLIVREDAQLLYGFMEKEEREMFTHLISVSGIGPNTALIMLSSLQTSEIANAIQTDDVRSIQSIKGIGAKTAQRIIIDLKDKMLKLNFSSENVSTSNNTTRFEALGALVSLGFDKRSAEKALDKVADADASVEKLIKGALKIL
jgi:Holliday junction DNA helicase RuvA